MSILSGFSGEYDGESRLELIQAVLRGLGSPVETPGTDTTADYSRYPKADILRELNRAQLNFVLKTSCLTTFAIVEGVGSQAEYRLPRRCMKVLDAKYYDSTTSYEQLVVKSDRAMMKRVSTSWRTDESGTPRYIYPGYGYGNVRSFGSHPKPASDGDTYSGTTMGIVTSATNFEFSGNITGTHKAGFADSAFLVDTDGRDFTTLGVVVGMMIFNTTDGSRGQITAIGNQDATNDKISVTLSGGTDDDFDVDDSFVITVGEYGVVIRADNTEEYAFSTEYGAIQDINPLSGNYLLDFVVRPLRLDSDSQYPDIQAEYHETLSERAIWKLGDSEFNGYVMKDRAAQARDVWFEGLEAYGVFSDPEIEPENFIEDREYLHFD